jgi:hydroxyacylglutathione hydrolase
MIIKKLVVGSLENNCYIIADEKTNECFITDPGDEPDRILDLIHKNNLIMKYIICTHAHFDHVAAIPEIKEETKARIVLHSDDLNMYRSTKDQAAAWGYEMDPLPEPDIFVSEGDILEVGGLKFEVITGDTLFAGSVGRTDLQGGDISKLRKSFKRLMSLPDDVKVLAGHGPESTIKKEKIDNFFSHEI